jgi:hypothetical protein
MLVYVPFVGWIDAKDASIVISNLSLLISLAAFAVALLKYDNDKKRTLKEDKINLLKSLTQSQLFMTSTIVELDSISTDGSTELAEKLKSMKTGFSQLNEQHIKPLLEDLLKPDAKLDDIVQYNDKVHKLLLISESMYDQVSALSKLK